MPEDNFLIETPRLRLIAAQLAHLRTELGDPAQLATLLGAEVPASWPPGEYDRDAIAYFLSQYEIRGAEAVGWYGWYAVRRAEDASRRAAGRGRRLFRAAERGRHGRDRLLDRGRGARSWLWHGARAGAADRALRQPQVRRVIAHAAPDNLASHIVLQRAGFHFAAVGASGKWRYERAAKPR